MGLSTAALIASTAIGAAASSRAASKASKVQRQAAESAERTQREIFERQTELQEPFRQSGIAAQNELRRLLGIGEEGRGAGDYGLLTRQYGMDQFQQDPGYAFRLSEGMKALDRSAAARGGLLSGATLKGAQRYGQDLASQEFTNAFNRYQAQLGTRLGTLGSMYGGGQAAAGQLVGAAGQMGEGISNALMTGGQARASGYLGQANAFNQMLGQAALGYGLYGRGAGKPPSSSPGTPPYVPIMDTFAVPSKPFSGPR
jgi:hypothetical protein